MFPGRQAAGRSRRSPCRDRDAPAAGVADAGTEDVVPLAPERTGIPDAGDGQVFRRRQRQRVADRRAVASADGRSEPCVELEIRHLIRFDQLALPEREGGERRQRRKRFERRMPGVFDRAEPEAVHDLNPVVPRVERKDLVAADRQIQRHVDSLRDLPEGGVREFLRPAGGLRGGDSPRPAGRDDADRPVLLTADADALKHAAADLGLQAAGLFREDQQQRVAGFLPEQEQPRRVPPAVALQLEEIGRPAQIGDADSVRRAPCRVIGRIFLGQHDFGLRERVADKRREQRHLKLARLSVRGDAAGFADPVDGADRDFGRSGVLRDGQVRARAEPAPPRRLPTRTVKRFGSPQRTAFCGMA